MIELSALAFITIIAACISCGAFLGAIAVAIVSTAADADDYDQPLPEPPESA